MVSDRNKAAFPALIRWLWAGNLMLLAVVFLAGLLVDGNGCLPGLNETLSTVVAMGLMGAGLVVTPVLACLDRRRLIYAIVMAALYLALLLPALAN